MRHAHIFLWVLLLAGCGASTQDGTPKSAPWYPDVQGSWSDTDALFYDCGTPDYNEFMIFTFEQSGPTLAGTLRWYSEFGTPFTEEFSGQVSEWGRVTARLDEAFESAAALDLQLLGSVLEGELTLLESTDCPGFERSKISMRLERE